MCLWDVADERLTIKIFSIMVRLRHWLRLHCFFPDIQLPQVVVNIMSFISFIEKKYK
jgi:protein-arginine kinase